MDEASREVCRCADSRRPADAEIGEAVLAACWGLVEIAAVDDDGVAKGLVEATRSSRRTPSSR
jgi:hypothetical protein